MPLPKEIEEMIKEEAKTFCKIDAKGADLVITSEDYSLAGLVAYNEAAKKYASEMIGFAEWCDENYYGLTTGNWYGPIVSDNKQQVKTTSELLTLYFKNRGIK